MKEQPMIRAPLRPIAPAGLLLALALCCGPAGAQQAEPAVLKRPAQLRELPAETARSLAALPAQEAVTRLGARQGLWIQVQTRAGVAGWVHRFDVGPAAADAAAGSAAPAASSAPAGGSVVTGSLRGLTNFLRGSNAPPPHTATSTIGIRGLDAEDLARARPDLDAVGRMEQLRLGESGARQFAAQAALVAATVPPLPAPAAVRSPQGGDGNLQQQ
jgi:hypothetical protein